MNWNQINTSTTPEERLEIALLILRTIEERQQRLILSRGRLVREKRGNFPGAHFLNDRRRLRRPTLRVITLASFAFMLLTVSAATWAFVLYAPAQLAALAMTMHITMLLLIITVKPYKLKLQTT